MFLENGARGGAKKEREDGIGALGMPGLQIRRTYRIANPENASDCKSDLHYRTTNSVRRLRWRFSGVVLGARGMLSPKPR